MAKFIQISNDSERYLNLECISYIDVQEKAIWTIEPRNNDGGQCKYVLADRPEAWKQVLDFLHSHIYVSSEDTSL